MSSTEAPVDVDVLRDEIKKTYTHVSTDADQDLIFPTGRARGPRSSATAHACPRAASSFAGVANHWTLGRIEPQRRAARVTDREPAPSEDGSVDVVISNGVIDLVPDKEAVFDEIDRVLRPGGSLQLAHVIIHTEVSEDARAGIDLWTG
jgi:arsenite methyltransferase